ncbi:MAG: tetratricopeptide repeat protein [Bacteroidota bacterium]
MAQHTRKRLRLILAYAAVPLVLVLAEIGLRLWAPDPASHIVQPVTFDGKEWLEVNRGYLRKYFPPGNPLVPELKPALIHTVKSENAFRVLCLGSSSMFGTPYQMTANIPGILRKQLRRAYPEKHIEVINFGASAINSNVVLDLSSELVLLGPDLIIIYMGHNEFYGPDGIGAGMLERNIPGFIQFKYTLRDMRLTAALLSLLPATTRIEEERNLMLEVSRRGNVRLDSDDAARVFHLFEGNYRDIIEFWQARNVPVISSELSSNLMFPPFAGDTVAPPSAMRMHELIVAFHQGRVDKCLSGLSVWRQNDSTNALVEYWTGRSLLMKGDTTGAKRSLQRARDLDLLKFRAPGEINAIIRRVNDELKVPVIPVDSVFSDLSPGGIPGDSLFWEHLHPNLRGYYEIARCFYEKMRVMNILPDNASSSRAALPFNEDSLSVCWLDLAYGDLSIQRLTGRWPFTNYHREPVSFPNAPLELQKIARAVYERRIAWDQGCYESASQFWRLGDIRRAITTYESLIEEYPSGFYPHYLLGNLHAKSGNAEAAIHHLSISIASNPRYPNSRLDLGLLRINAGLFDDAIVQLTAATSMPNLPPQLNANVHYGLAAAYANKEEYAQALSHVETALRLAPGYRDALVLKEGILNAQR